MLQTWGLPSVQFELISGWVLHQLYKCSFLFLMLLSSLCAAGSCESCSSWLKGYIFSLSRTTQLQAPTQALPSQPWLLQSIYNSFWYQEWGEESGSFILPSSVGSQWLRPFGKKKKRPFAKNLHLLIMHLKCQLHHVLNFLLHSYLLMDWTLFLFYFIAALIIIELKCFHIW